MACEKLPPISSVYDPFNLAYAFSTRQNHGDLVVSDGLLKMGIRVPLENGIRSSEKRQLLFFMTDHFSYDLDTFTVSK